MYYHRNIIDGLYIRLILVTRYSRRPPCNYAECEARGLEWEVSWINLLATTPEGVNSCPGLQAL
jgi:hypothetical protein